MLLFAVVRAIEIIGEAATKMTPEARLEAPDVPWGAIIGMRNRLIHGYFEVDTATVWKTAAEEIPALVPKVQPLLQTPHA
jgi:uncharacterized protein with HEPN domain